MTKKEEAEFKRAEKLRLEQERVEELCSFEKKYADAGLICGIDEVGRGPLAGPVVAAAVILPADCRILYINDSKKLSEKKREELCLEIREKAIAVGLGYADEKRIDAINILQATYEAMQMAIRSLSVKPDLVLVDAVHIPDIPVRQVSIVKGDARSQSIAAASIVAKVARDHLMASYDAIFPAYDFASNKGYGTAKHIQALKELGASPIHRKTFITKFL